jgi:hypothetical protein
MSTIGNTRPTVKSFVAGAPDAKAPRKRAERTDKVQITLLVPRRMLDQVDEIADRRGVSRSAMMMIWFGDGLAKEAA